MRGIIIITTLLLLFAACSGSDNEITPTLQISNPTIELKSGTKDTIHFEAKGIDILKWSTDNDFSISIDNNGIITANRIGETEVIVMDEESGLKATCKVNVIPSFNTIIEPSLNFGLSYEDLKSDMPEVYKFISGGDALGFLFFKCDLDYIDSAKSDFIENKFASVKLLLAKTDDMLEFLNERYRFVKSSGEGNIDYEFMDKNSKIKVLFRKASGVTGSYITYTQAAD